VKPASCAGCEFEVRGQGYVPGSGPPQARLVLLGQGPGRDEVATGKPFVGTAGRRLDIWLTKAGIPRQMCWIDNMVRCWIKVRGIDVAPSKAIKECRWRHWQRDLEEHAEPVIDEETGEPFIWVVGVGSAATKYLCGDWCGERAAGSLVEVEL